MCKEAASQRGQSGRSIAGASSPVPKQLESYRREFMNPLGKLASVGGHAVLVYAGH